MTSRSRVLVLASSLLWTGACATAGGGDDGDGGADAAESLDGAGGDAAPTIDANEADIDAFACMQSPCDLFPQCGCAAPLVCDLDFDGDLAGGATECRDVLSPGTETATCSAATDCGEGFVCVGDRCRRYCGGDDADCPGDGGKCLVQLQVGMTDIPGAITCTTACSPTETTNNGCPATWACHIYVYDPMDGSGLQPLTDCDMAGAGTDGATCTTNADCAAGFDCINVGGNLSCEPTCICPGGVCGGGTCPAGTGTCSNLDPPPVLDGVTYGVCL